MLDGTIADPTAGYQTALAEFDAGRAGLILSGEWELPGFEAAWANLEAARTTKDEEQIEAAELMKWFSRCPCITSKTVISRRSGGEPSIVDGHLDELAIGRQ